MQNNTKIKALMKQVDSGKMQSDLSMILDFIIREEFSSSPLICDALGLLRQTVTARLADLQDLGIIEVVETDTDPEYQIYTYQSNAIRQVQNAYQRKKIKFYSWKKRGEKEFSEFLHENQLEFNL